MDKHFEPYLKELIAICSEKLTWEKGAEIQNNDRVTEKALTKRFSKTQKRVILNEMG